MSNGEGNGTYGNLLRWFRKPVGVAALAVALVTAGLGGGTPAHADTCAPNPIVCENANPGTDPSVWDVSGSGDSTVQGFATDISVNVGGTVNFKVQAQHAYTIDIYRLGYYGGKGARFIASLPGPFPAQNQSVLCATSPETEILDCGTWAVSASWTVPATAVSGVYIAKLTRTDTGGASHITFVVRDDASTSDIVFKTSDATWQAYNTYGGADFYQGNVNGRAYKISYNRPYTTRGQNNGRDFLYSNEYPTIRFLERNGYDVSYTTDVDTDRYGSLLKNHKIFLSVGHDEYWSGNERSNVDAARDAGVNMAFFSGNEAYWKTYYDKSQDGNNTDYRTLVCYKETWDNTVTDPSSGVWEGTWRDPRFSPPLDGGKPENALTGTAFMSNHDDLPLQVPPSQGGYRLWRGTDVASQAAANQTATLPAHTIGYESDEDLDNGFRPAGLIDVSTTTGSTPEYLQDFGTHVAPGTTTHHMTMYKAASGALVFSAGTIQFAWGLDSNHDSVTTPLAADPSMQQMVVNLFADMGVQPATLMSGLTAASASTDTTAPTVSIGSPAAGTTVASGDQVTISGTASDTGGVVAGVEVSTDGGGTWHPATGTASWSYSFYASGVTAQTVQVRAVDDSLNIGTAATLSLAITGPYTVFGQRVPAVPASADATAKELGLRFTPKDNGYVTGVRFYKGTGNTGTHTGSLWSASGTQLATGTFTNETASGWQTLTFASPVAVTAGTTYVVSYFAPNGHFADDPYVFSYTDFVSPPLSVARTLNTVSNGQITTVCSGVSGYGSRFPVDPQTDGDNYYVDPVFTDSVAGTLTVVSSSPASGATQVAVGASVSATFSGATDSSGIQFTLKNGGTTVAGATSYDSASKTVTFTPSASLATGTTYTATVTATGLATAYSWSFTTQAYANLATLFASNATPTNASVNDPNAVSLGVKFTPSVDGQVIGVRFYKGPQNTGTHTGSLWTTGGTRLATATFSNESASGWQSVQFSSPVSVSAGVTYVASYYTPTGWYSADGHYFASAVTNGPLTAPGGSNGVYGYGTDTFPTGSYDATNYWVDPLFVPTGTTSSPSPSPSASPSPSPSPSPSATTTATAVGLFSDSATPTNASVNDPNAVSLGVKFTPSVDGQVIGVRFYKGSQNTGTHTGSLWTSGGTRLATATFSNESASGWQSVQFSSPVSVSAGVTYVASYYTPSGWYSADGHYFASAVTNGPLTAPGGPNGVYGYGSDSFPTSSYDATNYWVDPLFVPSGGTSSPSPTDSPSPSVSPSPSASPSPSPSPSASPLPSGAVTILSSSATPANDSWADPAAIEVGVAFTSDVNGAVYGVRFYKGSRNTGTHTGSLWGSDGTLLATGTFTGESATGWQTLVFSSPVTITAGTTYVASYSSTVGYYAADINAFATGLDNSPLHVPASGGRYHYGSGFPDGTAAHNYWVDVLFVPGS